MTNERTAAGQVWDTTLYDERHNYVWRFGEAVLDLLAPKPGERILDLGAGTGHLTKQIADAGAHVIGLDASASMVMQARELYPDIEFVEGDAADFSFDEPFDAVFSNATLHWVGRPEEVAACVSAALKPGGRFVAEFGGHGNVSTASEALRDARRSFGYADRVQKWYFPSIGEFAPILERHGLEVGLATLFDRPTPQADGAAGLSSWYAMFQGGLLDDVPADKLDDLLAAAAANCRDALFRDGTWYVDYRRIRVVARKL